MIGKRIVTQFAQSSQSMVVDHLRGRAREMERLQRSLKYRRDGMGWIGAV